MTGVTRTRWFWIAYALASVGCLALAWRLFPLAIPLVNLDIRLTWEEAVAKAEALAKERKLVPEGTRAAVQFQNDESAQNYIELEGGGKGAFAKMIAGTVYAPYWWEVRLFQPGTVEEAQLRFRPDGAVDGFTRRVAETYVRDGTSKALEPSAALELARARAHDDWGVDLGPYHLLDQAQETRPSGRVDHQFVFERDERFGDARIRLRLSVSGDELTGIAPFVHVPEKFERRFQELRSANDTIANFADVSAGALYGLGGCILAVLWLMRRHGMLWRPALVAGGIVGGLLALAVLAAIPAAWFGFDTAETSSAFWIRQAALALLALLGGTLGYGLAFAAAESLSRRAFPHQPQFWRLWSREAGATRQVAGRTAGGYLFVPVELALISAFYYATNQWLGWWQPSESLADPNVLSSAVPALAPIAMALQAGFMEECVFRAIPLTLGALLGAHFGRRGLGIAIAVVVQAVVFAGAHANYPGLPPYSRLVELLLPATLWALIFLRFGLLPTILLHALFDLSLMSIPLFLVDAPGAWTQRALVIAAAMVPVAVIVARRLQAGAWLELPASLWNGAWQPAAVANVAAHRSETQSAAAPRDALQRALPWLALAGAAAWLVCTPFTSDVPPLKIDRAGAEAAATAALAQRGVQLPPEWHRFSNIRAASTEEAQNLWHRFVWREAGAEAYREMVGKTLAPPMWEVRFARFEGDVAERAEEWRVTIVGDGQVRQVQHRLPEAAPAASLPRDAALAIAQRVVGERFGLDPAALQLRGADETRRDARSDWTFTFADPNVFVGKDGEARVQVVLAGDEVIAAGRAVFVPEAWQRNETERNNRLQAVKYAGVFSIVLGALAALVFAVISWSRDQCDRRALHWVAALVFVAAAFDLANGWPDIAMQLRTVEPVTLQVATLLAGGLFAALLVAGLLGLMSGVGAWHARSQVRVFPPARLPAWAVGVAVALAVAGLAAASGTLAPREAPLWPELKMAALAWPLGGALVDPFGLVPATGTALFVLFLLDRGTRRWTERLWMAALLLVLISFVAALVGGGDPLAALARGVVKGLLTFVLLWQVLRYDLRAIPAFLATGMVLEAARDAALEGSFDAWIRFAVSSLVTAAVTIALTRYIAQPLAGSPTEPSPRSE